MPRRLAPLEALFALLQTFLDDLAALAVEPVTVYHAEVFFQSARVAQHFMQHGAAVKQVAVVRVGLQGGVGLLDGQFRVVWEQGFYFYLE